MGGWCLGSALCCAGKMCCNLLCMPCKKAGVSSKNYAKIGYTFFQVIFIGLSLIFFFLSDKLVNVDMLSSILTDLKNYQNSDALAIVFVSRMSFILVLFHALIFLITLARNDMAAKIHDGCWATKFFVVVVSWIAAWWMPNSFFDNFYLPVAMYISAIFLIYQVILMLSAAYKINERLVENSEKDTGKCSSIILIFLTLCVTAGYIAWMITNFMNFKCTLAVVIQVITLLVIVLMYVLQFCGARPDASIFTNGLAALYVQYLQWTALSSYPEEECNPNIGASSAAGQIILGVIVTFFALFMMSGTAPTSDDPKEAQAVVDDEYKQSLNDNETTKADETKAKKRANGDDSEEEDVKKKNFIFAISKETIIFQLIMMLAAMYYCMLCTNWLQPGLFTDGKAVDMSGSKFKQIYWLKVASLWITLLIYIYSMIAPLLFPDRKF